MTAVVELISKEELTSEKLVEIYKQAYIDAHIGSDGDIALLVDQVKMFVKVEPTRALVQLYCIYRAKPTASREQILELCNRINDRLIMIRACFPAAAKPGEPIVFYDHYLDTEAGVTAEEMIDETRRFRNVLPSVPQFDTDGVLT